MEDKRDIQTGDIVYVVAEVTGVINGYNSGPKYAVRFNNGTCFFVDGEDIVEEGETT